MSEWLDYALSDFLLFSPEVYWRLPARINDWLWPLPIIATAVVAGLLAMMLHRPRRALLGAALIMAAAWISAGIVFVWIHYVPINWAAVYLLPLIGLGALVWLAVRVPAPDCGASQWTVLLLALTLLYPAIAPLAGHGLWSGEVFALAPDPVAAAAFGIAVAVRHRGWRMVLALPSILWLLASALTLWTMGGVEIVGPMAALAIGLAGLFAGPRREHE